MASMPVPSSSFRPLLACLAWVASGLLASCGSEKSTGGGSGTPLDTNTYGVPWSPSVSYGAFVDPRDHQSYRTVAVGSQTWMAENLDYAVDSSWCYSGAADSCSKYGRLYQWASALALADSCDAKACSSQVATRRQGVCPSGWHIPTAAEWGVLLKLVDSSNSGTRLESRSGWSGSNDGTDAYGFRALPGGYRTSYGSYGYRGWGAYFWTASENIGLMAWSRYFYSDEASVQAFAYVKNQGFSVRCLKN